MYVYVYVCMYLFVCISETLLQVNQFLRCSTKELSIIN